MRKAVALTKDEKKKIGRGESLKFAQPSVVPGYKDGDELMMSLCRDQDWKCFWCGEQMSAVPNAPRFRTKDHIVPLSTGKNGVNKAANLRAVCLECNQTRGQFNSMKEYARYTRAVEDQLRACQVALKRHKETMSGRCYYCKVRFHVLEWIHKSRSK